MSVDRIVKHYNKVIKGLFGEIRGGRLRSPKGTLVEDIAKIMVETAWANLGGKSGRLSFHPSAGHKKVRIPLKDGHIPSLPGLTLHEVIKTDDYYYDVGVDVHVYIDDDFVLGVECKSYAENAMLKRILVDFFLLKTKHPDLKCCLLQLETQLGGSNEKPGGAGIANRSTYTLMSYFPEVDLNILTLLEGQRDIGHPIHKRKYFKKMKPEFVSFAIAQMEDMLRPYCK